MGVVSPIGIGLNNFINGLKNGRTNFSITEFEQGGSLFKFPVAKLNGFNFKDAVSSIKLDETIVANAKRLRNISASTACGVYCALEAWADAGLDKADIDLSKIAIVSAGTNTQQAAFHSVQEEYRNKLGFINPKYGLNFFDTDIVGVLSELLGIKGEGHCIGAASASGNMAIIQGHRLLKSDDYDVVLVVAPLMDLSVFEYQGFTALGAMALADGMEAAAICRPFDADSVGFVYGQSAGCIILENEAHATKRSKQAYGKITGFGVGLDANRNPNPSTEGEAKAMLAALKMAELTPKQINYVNTHGTASRIGDKTEVDAIMAAGLEGVKANSTKSLIGHGLTAAGLVEAIATLVQMEGNFLHPSKNLVHPITDAIDWVTNNSIETKVEYAINNSFGFGGVNTSIVIER